MDAGGNVEVPDLLAEVNARVRELAESQSGGTATWDFRCECGDPDCSRPVPLTVAEYELLRAGGSPILAEGHEQSRLRAAREASRELSSEAVALRQQARLQAERARRNVDTAARRLELVCNTCGYGVRVERLPDRCPMCSASNWRPSRRPPSAD
jgi:predicted Zn-ribbon and HTH transcriptional regulator